MLCITKLSRAGFDGESHICQYRDDKTVWDLDYLVMCPGWLWRVNSYNFGASLLTIPIHVRRWQIRMVRDCEKFIPAVA